MELNLRKARKLEQKIKAHIESLDVTPEVELRVLADSTTRQQTLDAARTLFLETKQKQQDLIKARFGIRHAIGITNQNVGINELVNKREAAQATLEKLAKETKALDVAQVEDSASARKTQIEKGEHSYNSSVTITARVLNATDIEELRKEELNIKKNLEDIEDELSSKNVNSKIKLDVNLVNLLQSNGLL